MPACGGGPQYDPEAIDGTELLRGHGDGSGAGRSVPSATAEVEVGAGPVGWGAELGGVVVEPLTAPQATSTEAAKPASTEATRTASTLRIDDMMTRRRRR